MHHSKQNKPSKPNIGNRGRECCCCLNHRQGTILTGSLILAYCLFTLIAAGFDYGLFSSVIKLLKMYTAVLIQSTAAANPEAAHTIQMSMQHLTRIVEGLEMYLTSVFVIFGIFAIGSITLIVGAAKDHYISVITGYIITFIFVVIFGIGSGIFAIGVGIVAGGLFGQSNSQSFFTLIKQQQLLYASGLVNTYVIFLVVMAVISYIMFGFMIYGLVGIHRYQKQLRSGSTKDDDYEYHILVERPLHITDVHIDDEEDSEKKLPL